MLLFANLLSIPYNIRLPRLLQSSVQDVLYIFKAEIALR